MNERNVKGMNDQDFVSAITGNTGDSGWRNMVPRVNSSDFPTQWVPSAYECSIIEAQAKEIDALRNELCLKCGKYTLAYEGACDGCRWRRMHHET